MSEPRDRDSDAKRRRNPECAGDLCHSRFRPLRFAHTRGAIHPDDGKEDAEDYAHNRHDRQTSGDLGQEIGFFQSHFYFSTKYCKVFGFFCDVAARENNKVAMAKFQWNKSEEFPL